MAWWMLPQRVIRGLARSRDEDVRSDPPDDVIRF